MSLKQHEENPIEADMNIFQNEITQVQNMITLNVYSNPLVIEEKIKWMKLQYEWGILRILRSWWFDEDAIDEQKKIVMSN